MIPRIPSGKPRNLSKPLEKVRLQVQEGDHGKRLDKFLASMLPWRSRASVQKLINEKRIIIEGRENPRSSTRLRQGEIVTILVPPSKKGKKDVCAGDQGFDSIPVLFEDEFLVAVDKPPGLPVHPSGKHLDNTLITLLHKKYTNGIEKGEIIPKLCHRLDKETSGIVLVTKQEGIRHLMGKLFEQRKVKKAYLAVVHGALEQEKGIIDLPLGPDPFSKVKMKMRARHDGKGIPALTKFKVIKEKGEYSLLEITPVTGRQHQIRVHLSAIGHPIVGDKIYGPDENFFLDSLEGKLGEEALKRLVLTRHALHAWKLSFVHPVTKEDMEIVSPIPEDMAGLVGGVERFRRKSR